jgi:phosphate transport system substrate-binding protein
VSRLRWAALGGAIVLALAFAACGDDSVPLSGSIRIDGSTTVAPLTKAIAARFVRENPGVHVAVAGSGTDDGFAALCRGAIDASDAVEPIGGPARAACERAGVAAEPIPVADDAVVLMVNPKDPIRCLTTRQLTQIWHRNSEVTSGWSQVDGLDPPFDGPMTAWGPGTDTEPFAFFNTAVNGRIGSYRDYNNTLHREGAVVEAIAHTPGLLGYADYRFYAPRARSVRAIAVDSGDGCVAPGPETIADGSFRPLSRRLFVHPSARALARPAMAAFMRFYLDRVREVAPRVGFIAPTDAQLEASRARLERSIAAARRQRR